MLIRVWCFVKKEKQEDVAVKKLEITPGVPFELPAHPILALGVSNTERWLKENGCLVTILARDLLSVVCVCVPIYTIKVVLKDLVVFPLSDSGWINLAKICRQVKSWGGVPCPAWTGPVLAGIYEDIQRDHIVFFSEAVEVARRSDDTDDLASFGLFTLSPGKNEKPKSLGFTKGYPHSEFRQFKGLRVRILYALP